MCAAVFLFKGTTKR